MEAFPNSWNVYNSLAEAYLENSDKELAIQNFKKSLELNPDNKDAKKQLKKLQAK